MLLRHAINGTLGCRHRLGGVVVVAPTTEQVIESYDVSTNWKAPLDLVDGTITVEGWGAGGGGGSSADSTSVGAGGGGGGAYGLKSGIVVTPGNDYLFTVGAGGLASLGSSGQDGEASIFAGDLETLTFNGGKGGSNEGSGGAGGTVNSGTVRFAGGNGGPGNDVDIGGGGGGGAGTTMKGAVGKSSTVGGAGGAGGTVGGGDGSAGALADANDGTQPGGGGGGSISGTGGDGGAGRIRLTYTKAL